MRCIPPHVLKKKCEGVIRYKESKMSPTRMSHFGALRRCIVMRLPKGGGRKSFIRKDLRCFWKVVG